MQTKTVSQQGFTPVGHFVGMASPSAILDGLGSNFPQLDEFVRILRQGTASSDFEREILRQIEAWSNFVNLPPGNSEREFKVGVRAPLLEKWVGERWVDRCIRLDANGLSMSQVQQIVDSQLPDVPIERPKNSAEGTFEVLVVDRDAFALELARESVRSVLPRSPVALNAPTQHCFNR